MTELSKYRLIYRSLAMNHIYWKHGKTLCVHPRFLLRRNDRKFATFVSEKRSYYFDGRFQFFKRPTSSHYHRYFIRYSSEVSDDLKPDITSDSTTDVPNLAPSTELSSDESAVTENRDPFELFLDTFPQTIKGNVHGVISNVDGVTSPHVQPDDATKISAQCNESLSENLDKIDQISFSSTKRLRKRWERILRKEKERYRRRNRTRSNRRRFDRAKLSIKAQWDEALRRNGYCIATKSSEGEQNVEPAYDTIGAVSELLECNEIDDPSPEIYLSPIFGFQVNPQEASIDFETALPIAGNEEREDPKSHIEVQPLVATNPIEEEEVKRANTHNTAIFESISLLIAMRREDWRKYESSMHLNVDGDIEGDKIIPFDEVNVEQESVHNGMSMNELYDDENKIRKFLRYVVDHKYALKTSDVNLVLAYLVTSTDGEHREIADCCLQIFREMKMLGKSGQHDCRPDSTTYRLLLLAFSRRFQAVGEALRISQEMVEHSTIDIKPELLNEAFMVCRTKTELNVARLLMDHAIRDPRITINAGSCILYTEMLKTRKLDQEAIEIFRRVKEANLLNQRDEDEYLVSLCRWPQRSRRGDVLDLSSFWTDIRSILEQKTLYGKAPDIRVWLTFLEGLYESAKNDDSLWKMAANTTRTVLDAYPRSFVGRKLMTIGIDASSHIEDTQLISLILKRLSYEPSIPKNQSSLTEENSDTIIRSAKVPFRALKNSLEICLETSDAQSAQSILESMNRIGDPYPMGAKYELYSLVLKCHAKVNDAENASQVLNTMIENNMRPSEELYSQVLRAMAAAGRYADMEELFQSIQSGQVDGIEPGILTYDAILFARIEEKSWDDVCILYDEIKAKGIKPSSNMVQGLITANDEKDGRKSVLSALESLLLSSAQFDESVFRLASKILFQEINGTLDDFRKIVREIGEGNPDLRDASLDLVRSIRFAEVESGRANIVHDSKYEEAKNSGEDAWQVATSKLLVFSQGLFESKDEIE